MCGSTGSANATRLRLGVGGWVGNGAEGPLAAGLFSLFGLVVPSLHIPNAAGLPAAAVRCL